MQGLTFNNNKSMPLPTLDSKINRDSFNSHAQRCSSGFEENLKGQSNLGNKLHVDVELMDIKSRDTVKPVY